MEVRTLGRLRRFGDGVAASDSVQGPPSSQAVVGLLRGESGSFGRVLASTALRSLLLAPGAGLAGYVGGARGWRLAASTAAGATLGSLGITLFLIGYYKFVGVPSGASAGAPASPVPGSQVQGPPQGLAPTVDPSSLWGGQSMDPRTLNQIQAHDVTADVNAATDAQMSATMPAVQGLRGLSAHNRGHGRRASGTGW